MKLKKQYKIRAAMRIPSILFLTTLMLGVSFPSNGQGPIKTDLKINYKAKQIRLDDLISLAGADTLHLPFFDDFAYDGPDPSDSIWTDNLVFVNNTFSKDQITRGMATFDHLDANGTPYDFLSRFASSYADTLTSQCINLEKDENGRNYIISDSLYLSWFVQTGGLGDAPEAGDSFILQFKLASDTVWENIWNITGNSAVLFTEYRIPILDTKYLYNTFQFRFLNYVKNSGNMNHYHLDYVRMNLSRSFDEKLEKGIAFTLEPSSLLGKYSIMPYSHFLSNPGSFLRATNLRNFYMRNNDNNDVSLVLYNVETRDEQNNVLYSFAATNAENISPGSTIVKQIDNFSMNALVGDTPTVNTTYSFNANSSQTYDTKEKNEYLNDLNNSIESVQQFHHYYAYDDGSAEAGYALDYAGLPSGPGYTVVGFDLAMKDTLQGVDIHFNRAFEEVGNRPIKIQFWSSIANGAGNTDQFIYELNTVPTYVNGRNGFARFELDTLIELPAGTFYVGWQQNSNFKINVGWDENYAGVNSNIYYNLIGFWQPLPPGFEGTLMVRPLIGKPIIPKVSVPSINEAVNFKLYPNPSEGKFIISAGELVTFSIYNLSGKLVQKSASVERIHSIELNAKGIYLCIVSDKHGLHSSTKKIIIQ